MTTIRDDLISRVALIAAYDVTHKGPPGGARKLIETAPSVDAILIEWLNEKEQKAERDVFYCKGDAKKNVEIIHAIRVIKELVHDETEAE